MKCIIAGQTMQVHLMNLIVLTVIENQGICEKIQTIPKGPTNNFATYQKVNFGFVSKSLIAVKSKIVLHNDTSPFYF